AVRSLREELLEESQALADARLGLRLRDVDSRPRQVLPQHRGEGTVPEGLGARIGPVPDGPAEDVLSKAVSRALGIAPQLVEMLAVVREELDLGLVGGLLLSVAPVGPKQVVDGATDYRIREELLGVTAR